ncbi:hypothetical protein PUN28_003187 [Cardiocondyla obscurior]|uniref:Ribosomal protein S16 n=1 Tax=Cardiocondyla obscurior TaxID=286306 RepID=A0AAW2GIF1_9HYME
MYIKKTVAQSWCLIYDVNGRDGDEQAGSKRLARKFVRTLVSGEVNDATTRRIQLFLSTPLAKLSRGNYR